MSELESRLRAINKMAEVRRTQRSRVDVDYVLGVGGFDLGNVEKELDLTLRWGGGEGLRSQCLQPGNQACGS